MSNTVFFYQLIADSKDRFVSLSVSLKGLTNFIINFYQFLRSSEDRESVIFSLFKVSHTGCNLINVSS